MAREQYILPILLYYTRRAIAFRTMGTGSSGSGDDVCFIFYPKRGVVGIPTHGDRLRAPNVSCSEHAIDSGNRVWANG